MQFAIELAVGQEIVNVPDDTVWTPPKEWNAKPSFDTVVS